MDGVKSISGVCLDKHSLSLGQRFQQAELMGSDRELVF